MVTRVPVTDPTRHRMGSVTTLMERRGALKLIPGVHVLKGSGVLSVGISIVLKVE